MRHIKLLITGVAMAAMVTFVACNEESKKSQEEEQQQSIPTTPIRLAPMLTAASTHMDGNPTEFPTTCG